MVKLGFIAHLLRQINFDMNCLYLQFMFIYDEGFKSLALA